ncbi:MAG: hypothetical protein ACYCPT_02110 [Acidimicrobiales bacterium]
MPHDADGAMLSFTPSTACSNLAALGCEEGASRFCVTALAHVIDAGLETFDVPCISTATSKASVRACAGMSGGCR